MNFIALSMFTLLSFNPDYAESPAVETGSEKKEKRLQIRTYGVKVNVDDLEKALSFYCGKLGFEAEEPGGHRQQVILKADDRVKLILNRVQKLKNLDPGDTKLSFTLQVNDLDSAIAKMRALGVSFGEKEKRKEAVGSAIFIQDPFGRLVSLMHQTIVKVEPFKEPRLYNFGFRVPDMDAARDFYCNKLGFTVRSEKYLPLDLPLGHDDNTFAFMLHYRPDVRAVKSEYPKAAPFNILVFETTNLDATVSILKKKGVKFLNDKPQKNVIGNSIAFEDPFGNVSELLEVSK